MNASATITILLAQGSPTSVLTAQIGGRVGKVVAGPRSQLVDILKREEATLPAVYFLTGVNPKTGKDRVYIGKTAVGMRKRFNAEHRKIEFWKTILFFVGDDNFTETHIKYLEGKLIETARAAGRFELANVQSSGSSLPESDLNIMEGFISSIEMLLPILGHDFLKPLVNREGLLEDADLLFCKIKEVKATGRQTDKGFVVLKQSEAVLKEIPSTIKYPYATKLRTGLIADGTLVEKDEHLIFSADCEFSSPSAAAAVIQGGQANGLTAWKDSKGISLKDREMKKIQQASSGYVTGTESGE